jgi:transcriptional regulator with XRE-family HTH domain
MDDYSIMQDTEDCNQPVDTSDINTRIAARVRGLRGSLGMSLEGLAERCGVSRSMISLIERGESSATAVVLEKLASGLGVPLAALFDNPALPASPISRRNDRTSWRDPGSGYLRRNISPANFPSSLHIIEVTLPAGVQVAYESASLHDVDQQVWVQDGRIEVTVGQTTHHLVEDDCLAMRLGEPIAFANRTRRPARYIVAIASEQPQLPRRSGR